MRREHVGRKLDVGQCPGHSDNNTADDCCNSPHGDNAVAASRTADDATADDLPRGAVSIGFDCRAALDIANKYIERDENASPTGQEDAFTVDGYAVTCAIDTSADGGFGNATCADTAGDTVVFRPSPYPYAPGPPLYTMPESAATQAECSYLYNEWLSSGETNQAAIQAYAQAGCQ